jgi:hypothetical protein
MNFGSSRDTLHVWLNGRTAQIVNRGQYTVTFQLPLDADPKTAVSVEVNACRGNAFTVETR